ncbi:MAG: hypothetical protein ACFFC7_29665 [Candidatus Hermodarchaeota archaeon]
MNEKRRGYILLVDGSIHLESEKPPQSLYVRGYIQGEIFLPEGDILGEGPLGEAGHPGWMELTNGIFYGMETSRPPFPPYVEGYRTPKGEFRPSSRQVVY